MTRAPNTGPVARRTARHSPSALMATLRSTAADSESTRNAQVGPEPDTSAPSAPYSRPASSTSFSRGCRSDRSGLKVVDQRGAEQLGVAAPQRVHEVGGDLRRLRMRAQLVETSVDGRGGQAVVAERQHPVVGPPGQGRGDLLTPAATDRGAAEQGERHVAAQLGRERAHRLRRDVDVPQHRAGQQRGSAVGRTAGQSPGHRDGLLDRQADAERVVRSVGAGQQLGRPDRQVGLVLRHQLRPLAGDADLELLRVRPRRVHLVVERHRLVHRGQRMEAVAPRPSHLQRQVDLGRNAYAHADRRRRERGGHGCEVSAAFGRSVDRSRGPSDVCHGEPVREPIGPEPRRSGRTRPPRAAPPGRSGRGRRR